MGSTVKHIFTALRARIEGLPSRVFAAAPETITMDKADVIQAITREETDALLEEGARADYTETTIEPHALPNAITLAAAFHDAYERWAPVFGYETREETRTFRPDSPNGCTMIAASAQILADVLPGLLVQPRTAPRTIDPATAELQRASTRADKWEAMAAQRGEELQKLEEDVRRLREQRDRQDDDPLQRQVNRLTDCILELSYPIRDEGACDAAIRLLREAHAAGFGAAPGSEDAVLEALGRAMNSFNLLRPQHLSDLPDFAFAIHLAQNIVLARIGQRAMRERGTAKVEGAR